MSNSKKYYVYKHTSPSGKVYIGITRQKASKRWQAGGGYSYNVHFINAIKNMGGKILVMKFFFLSYRRKKQKKKKYL